ncbi:MAG: uroporphyrinogen-III C-methyltransferase [Nitrososphaerales archaeon]
MKGIVYLVGAGPGDPKLLTLRAVEVLGVVDVVLHDRLISREVLNTIPRKTRKINVGKEPHSRSTSQDEIIRMMVSYVERGKSVARLKGGDALFFSRGAEEARAMKERGIDFEIVPGVSSALAAPAYAGIPLTQRKHSSSVLIATGQEGRDKEKKINWRKVPSSSVDTIVVLMGVEKIWQISNELIKGGLDPDTPVGAIEWGTTRKQKTTILTLGESAKGLARVKPPCVFVIGNVARIADELNWFGKKISRSKAS